jgi:hypothetical protein
MRDGALEPGDQIQPAIALQAPDLDHSVDPPTDAAGALIGPVRVIQLPAGISGR